MTPHRLKECKRKNCWLHPVKEKISDKALLKAARKEMDYEKATAILKGQPYPEEWDWYLAKGFLKGFEAGQNSENVRRLVEAARGLSFGVDWNNGTHAKEYRPKLIEALQPFITGDTHAQ